MDCPMGIAIEGWIAARLSLGFPQKTASLHSLASRTNSPNELDSPSDAPRSETRASRSCSLLPP